MTAIEKILMNDPAVQKKAVDVLSLFRGEDYAFMDKVLKVVKFYGEKNSLLDFVRAVNEINKAATTIPTKEET